jgi:hypothetical protein
MPEFFKKLFNREAPAPLTPVETLLKERGVKYRKEPDGTLLVRRDLDFSFQKLDALPDLSSVTVEGNFHCGHNEKLSSLAGAPLRVSDNIRCVNTVLSYVGPEKLSFGSMTTDHGTYNSWEEIPHWLRLDDAGKRRLIDATPAEDRAQMNEHLKWALRTEDTALVKICIGKGADVNCDGGEPLLIVARRESIDLAGLLCIAGAEVERAIKTAGGKLEEVTYYDAGCANISDRAVFNRYDPPMNWLFRQQGAMRDKVQLHKIEELQQANAGLLQRVATLEAEAAKPAELDKPKIKPPGM